MKTLLILAGLFAVAFVVIVVLPERAIQLLWWLEKRRTK